MKPSRPREGDGVRQRGCRYNVIGIPLAARALEVARGETLRFAFTNNGEVAHDAFIADNEGQADHEAEMRQSDDGHRGDHDAENAVTVEPGDTGELIYAFEEAGTLKIGCHQPGHYDAGMAITVEVT